VDTTAVTSVAGWEHAAGERLGRPHPNPFDGATSIRFHVPSRGAVSLEVFTVGGRSIRTLHEGILPRGTYTRVWDGTDRSGREAAAGVYFYRLKAEGGVDTRRVVLLR
jgi:hypothetical protein